MRVAWCVLVFAVMTACVGDSNDEAEGEDIDGKADGISLVGTYVLPSGGTANYDMPSLQLVSGGSYVRVRCYGARCAKKVPETDRYRAVRNPTTGKLYLRFERFAWTDFANRESEQLLADSYEVK